MRDEPKGPEQNEFMRKLMVERNAIWDMAEQKGVGADVFLEELMDEAKRLLDKYIEKGAADLAHAKGIDADIFKQEMTTDVRRVLMQQARKIIGAYRGYHALVGSSGHGATKDDFDGEDSVEAFLARMRSTYEAL
jgi:hypothetical protein